MWPELWTLFSNPSVLVPLGILLFLVTLPRMLARLGYETAAGWMYLVAVVGFPLGLAVQEILNPSQFRFTFDAWLVVGLFVFVVIAHIYSRLWAWSWERRERQRLDLD